METAIHAREEEALSPAHVPAARSNHVLAFDTTQGSLLHRALRRNRADATRVPLMGLWQYLLATSATFVPLALVSAASLPTMTQRSSTLQLPFLRDWNVLFMFLVSFPLLVYFASTDDQLLSAALSRVLRDDIIHVEQPVADRLVRRWAHIFRNVNDQGQLWGVAFGIVIAYANYRVYTQPGLRHWTTSGDALNPAGGVYLYCIGLFYSVFFLFVLRSVTMSLFLGALVRSADIRLVPFHPDRCGGIRPVGTLGLRNQYALTVGGINVMLFVVTTVHYLKPSSALDELMIAAALCYFVVSPLVFLGPLIPFRAGMLRAKHELMTEVADRLRRELSAMRIALRTGKVLKEDEELIDRLRKVAGLIDDFPVWPFDALTLRKFISAYLFPVAASLGIPVAKFMGQYLLAHVR